MDTQKSGESESDAFETIAPEKYNPVRKEFEIGQPWPRQRQEDARARDETGHGAKSNTKPSPPRYYCMRLVPAKKT
jgi:hypothetical protein